MSTTARPTAGAVMAGVLFAFRLTSSKWSPACATNEGWISGSDPNSARSFAQKVSMEKGI